MNLFLLTAPYQILNALEAIHHFKFTDNHLWIIDTGHFNRVQFESVIDPAVWQSVRFHDFRYKLTHLDFGEKWPATLWERVLELYLLFDQFCKRQRADRITSSFNGRIDNLILGNYRRDYDRHMRHMANRLHFGHLYLLDVGTDTLRISQDRKHDHLPQDLPDEAASGRTLKRLKLAVKSALFAWDTHGAPALTFFTTYDLTLHGQDRAVHNEYTYLQSVVAGAKISNKVIFVGQPLVDQRYITLENFSLCLSKIKDHFDGQQIVYIPHPRESEEQLHAVRKLAITIERITAPFEYAVAFSGERPRCIASFFSSAVENCAAIFGGTVMVKAFRLPAPFLLKQREEVARVYRQFAENRHVLIDVQDIPS